MNLHDIAQRIRVINKANGFDAPSWQNLPTKMMMVVTELNEARTAICGLEQDPLAEELADTAIRLLDILGTIWPGDWAERWPTRDRSTEGLASNPCFQQIEVLLWKPLEYISMAVEAWRYEKQNDTRVSIELALSETFSLAFRLGFNMRFEIERKLKRNSQRGHLHGKNRSEG